MGPKNGIEAVQLQFLAKEVSVPDHIQVRKWFDTLKIRLCTYKYPVEIDSNTMSFATYDL